jgi:hypothetical protein
MVGRKMIVVASLIGLVVGASAMAFAGSAARTQSVDRAAPRLNTLVKAQGISAVAVATSDVNDVSTSTTTPTLLPGMSAKVRVPAGRRALLMVRFSAETACYGGGTSPNWCVVEVLVDGIEASPGDGADFALDSTDNGTETSASWESHSTDRSILVGEGPHTVEVVGYVTDFSTTGSQTFWTGERSMTVERALLKP